MKKLRVTIEGKTYDVLVEVLDESAAPPSVHVAPAPSAPGAPAAETKLSSRPAATATGVAASPGDIPSPLAGKVVSIDVTVGQAVKPGDQLATIEAMKMNTFVYSDASGTVAAVLAQVGGAVEEGGALLRLS